MVLAPLASGDRILNHTAYEHESLRTKGGPSRGVFLLNAPNRSEPGEHEPSFVKSHVTFYGDEPASTLLKGRRALERTWLDALPPGCGRHLRLLRNPLDNLRARYHLYLKKNEKNSDTLAGPALGFGISFARICPVSPVAHALQSSSR